MSPAGSRFRPYPAYKDSGVEWLGPVPAGWTVERLKNTIVTIRAGTWGDEPTGDEADTPCIRVADFDRERFLTAAAPTQRSISPAERLAHGLRAGDLLIEKSGGGELQPVGAVVGYDPGVGAAVCSNFIARIRLHAAHVSRFHVYLHATLYALRVNTRWIKQSTGIQNLDLDGYLTERVALPAGEEQRVIAAFLDSETARIDALIAKKKRLIQLLQERRTALISHVVTRGLDSSARTTESGTGWLGRVPAHWELKRLWHLTSPDRQIMYGIVLPGPDVDEGVPIVKGGDIGGHRLRVDALNRTTFEIESGHARSRLRGGDLVFAIRGSIGEVAMVPDELLGANLTQDAARVSPTDSVHGRWLMYALKAPRVFAHLDAGALGATIRGINIRDLKRVSIPVPPLPEQRAIAAFLDAEAGRIDGLAARVREGIERLKELRTALISAAVTGKIDVRGEAT